MIAITLQGGLGNQMFQYATAYAVAKRNAVDLQLDIRYYQESKKTSVKGIIKRIYNKFINKRFYFRDFDLKQFSISYTNLINNTNELSIYTENKGSLYDQNFLKIKEPCILNGFFQCEKYFVDFKDDIRKEFKFKEVINPNLKANSVAVHIRRGDYVKLVSSTLVCTPYYYEKSIEYIQNKIKNPVFYIFSEDIEWCKQNIKFPINSIFIDYNPNLPNSHDMQFMSLCAHQIISNSTYSWWAAWLNKNPNKIIITPDKWFVNREYEKIYTENMVRISTKEKI